MKDLLLIINTYLENMTTPQEKIQAINALRAFIHEKSPFKNEPVDCVLWVKVTDIQANDYNPNVMAPAEKKLLKRSLDTDGFTQPIVVFDNMSKYIVVDGFHRHLVGKIKSGIGKRLHGYLPVTKIKSANGSESERVAATIRHNRARGKHTISPMSDIVRELSRLGWDDNRIGMELGMDQDEILRLKQIGGLADLFAGEEYSEAWTVR
ncbi:TPA: ParB-like nuclease domain-containing protein [Klebsiella oxytoca]|uniref:IbrB-like domain-containing protein n=1 Tax=Klebsiella oxytoca TaxID=571 RepID=UPI00277B72B3|nr:ParB-like nuclease domain-containing protein [Klebsiella oxytoca]